jgi:hypothetical protein
MKTTTLIVLGMMLFSTQFSTAQAKIDTLYIRNANVDPSAFVEIRYYYFPNLQAYFDTKRALYIYKQNGSWVTSETIDFNARGYCLKNGMHVMIKGYLGDKPYILLEQHKIMYPANYSSKPTAIVIASVD